MSALFSFAHQSSNHPYLRLRERCACDASQQCDEIIKFSWLIFRNLILLLMVFCFVCLIRVCELLKWCYFDRKCFQINFELSVCVCVLCTHLSIYLSAYLYLFLVKPIKNGFGIGRAEVELI